MLADARRARTSLAMLAGGSLLVVIDVRIGKVDLVPDLLGLVLAAVALVGLVSQTSDAEAGRWLRAAATLAIVAIPVSMLADLDVPVHAVWRLGELALDLAGYVITCIGMEELTRAADLPASHATWGVARRVAVGAVVTIVGGMLFVPFLGGVIGLVVLGVVALATVTSFVFAALRTRAEIA